jgi:hypothetical protein
MTTPHSNKNKLIDTLDIPLDLCLSPESVAGGGNHHFLRGPMPQNDTPPPQSEVGSSTARCLLDATITPLLVWIEGSFRSGRSEEIVSDWLDTQNDKENGDFDHMWSEYDDPTVQKKMNVLKSAYHSLRECMSKSSPPLNKLHTMYTMTVVRQSNLIPPK